MYQFPKEQTFFGKQNSWCDKNQGDETGYAIFLPKDRWKLPKEHDYWLFCLFWTNHYSIYSVNSAIGSRIDGIIFRSFQKQKRSQKNTITANSMYSQFRIVPKECAPNWLFWSTEPQCCLLQMGSTSLCHFVADHLIASRVTHLLSSQLPPVFCQLHGFQLLISASLLPTVNNLHLPVQRCWAIESGKSHG